MGFQLIVFVINVVIIRLVIFTCLCILNIFFSFFFNVTEVLRFLLVVAEFLSGGSWRPAGPVKKSWGSMVIVQAVGSGLDFLDRFP